MSRCNYFCFTTLIEKELCQYLSPRGKILSDMQLDRLLLFKRGWLTIIFPSIEKRKWCGGFWRVCEHDD